VSTLLLLADSGWGVEKMKMGDDRTIMTITNVKPSLRLDWANGIPTSFIVYWMGFVNSTYLELETFLTLIKLRF
jgi:hypothetical protein